MGKKKSLYERRQQAGREGMAVRLYGLDAAGRKAMIAPAHEAMRRRCEAQALAEFRRQGEVPTAAELAARTDELRLEWCRAMGRRGDKKAQPPAPEALGGFWAAQVHRQDGRGVGYRGCKLLLCEARSVREVCPNQIGARQISTGEVGSFAGCAVEDGVLQTRLAEGSTVKHGAREPGARHGGFGEVGVLHLRPVAVRRRQVGAGEHHAPAPHILKVGFLQLGAGERRVVYARRPQHRPG